MPPPVRRSVFVFTALLALVLAGAALAGNGGLAPPSPASPNAEHIRDVYWLILAVTGAIFLLVTVTLLVFVVRYRSPGRPRAGVRRPLPEPGRAACGRGPAGARQHAPRDRMDGRARDRAGDHRRLRLLE